MPSHEVPLRRNRDFSLLWTGQAISELGTRAGDVALPLLVLAVTASPAKTGIVAFAGGIPYVLFGLPAGALADRWEARHCRPRSSGTSLRRW
jgi:MFS family permease